MSCPSNVEPSEQPSTAKPTNMGNKISRIQANAFFNLSQCTVLNLHRNNPNPNPETGAFKGLPALTSLTLKSNLINRLHLNIFFDLLNCTVLNLQDNFIFEVELGAFNGLTALRTLKFSNNVLEGQPCLLRVHNSITERSLLPLGLNSASRSFQ